MRTVEKEFCERCLMHKSCGYVERGLESACTELQNYSDGYDRAIEYLKQKVNALIDEQPSDAEDYKKMFNILNKLENEQT